MALVTRKSENNFEAQLNFGTQFIAFSGACDPEVGRLLFEALRRDQGDHVKSLRRDPHEKDDTCWLHGEGWCFSRRSPVQAQSIT
jgi:protein-L-isoaspartate(D-aspartate) O-methyltransferase